MDTQETTKYWIETINIFVEDRRQRYLETAEDNDPDGDDANVEAAECAYEEYAEYGYAPLVKFQGAENLPEWKTAINRMLFYYTDFIIKAAIAHEGVDHGQMAYSARRGYTYVPDDKDEMPI